MNSPHPSASVGSKSERYDEILHEFNQSRQRAVLRRDKVYRHELGVEIGELGHEAVVSARHGRRGSQEVGTTS